jgi:DNA-binding SARP family transcriptional activator
MVLQIRLLGGFDARLASGTRLSLPSKKAQGLLAYLGARLGESHPRDKLATLLWGGTSDHQARDSLRHAVAALRKALPVAEGVPPVLRVDGQTLALDPGGVEVDVVTFERRVKEGTVLALEDAAELYRGDLLLGMDLSEPLFEDWLVAERERLRETALEAMVQLLALQSRTAGTERAILTAVRLLALDPLQERVHRTLMQLYVRQGRRGAALKQYQLCVDRLERELGTEPEAETKALYRELLQRSVDVPGVADAAEDRRARASLELPAVETPLFGRQADVASLQMRLEEVNAGHGHVATVVGEAGIGKTRLVTTLATDAVTRGCRVLIGRCHEGDALLPFAPWVDACRAGRLDADHRVLARLHPARRAELARLLPETGTPDLPSPSDSLLPLFESVSELLQQVAAQQPLVMVLEDMHWADEMSLRLLAFIGRRLPSWPALLIVTAREEDLGDAALPQRTIAELSRIPLATTVRLAPLSRADIGLIVRTLVRAGSDTATLASLEEGVWAMSEGNPLVAVEAMLALAAPRRRDGARESPGELSLPERVRELIATRLDRLSPPGQSVAAVAAVIGRRFDFALLRSASGVDDRAAAGAVEELVRTHVLRTVGNQLEFTHDRVRDVAYHRLLPPRRRLVHADVAKALEAVSQMSLPDRPSEHIEQLVHHAVRGELWDKAVSYLRQAADRAAARSALQHARTALEGALDILGTMPRSRSTEEQAFDIRLALRPLLVQLGELRQALHVLREAEALAERLNDDGRRGQVCAFLTNIHSRLDEPAAAVVTGNRALEIAGRLGDLRLRILATTYLGQAHYCRGEYARVIELATGNLDALPAEWVHEFFGSSQPASVNDRFRLLVSLAHLGRFAEAAEHEAAAIRLAESTHHPYTVGVAYYAAGTLHLIKGEWERARALIERQIAVLRAGNAIGELPTALAYSARALAYLCDGDQALDRCREAERLLEGQPERGRAGTGWIYYSLGRAHLVLGRLDEARRLAACAVESASGRTDFLPDALQLVGDVATQPEEFETERSAASYAEALALAEERGMHPVVAHCHLGLARLHRATGDRARAREHLATATAMYREMDMEFWLEEAQNLDGICGRPGVHRARAI